MVASPTFRVAKRPVEFLSLVAVGGNAPGASTVRRFRARNTDIRETAGAVGRADATADVVESSSAFGVAKQPIYIFARAAVTCGA